MRTRFTLLLPAVALATGMAACGAGGPSKSAFTKKADASCVAGNTAISSAAKPTNDPQIATAAGTAGTTIDGQVAALRAMKTPGGNDKKQIDGIIGAIADVGGPVKALQDAAAKTDDAAMAKAAVDLQAKSDAAATQASAYGLTQCGTALKPAVANLFDGAKSVVKASFVSKSQALCRDASRKSDAIAAPGTSAASLGKYFDAQIAVYTKLVTDLRAVTAPPGDEATVGDLTGAMDALNAKVKEMSTAAKANNLKLVAALSDEADVANTAVNAKADAYGLTVCGSVGG
ncbi:MAG TPA: hypothetical protein VHT97_02995 [Acidimicrobiales bacterium]|nr:hypothetical protein [Acidimicrobiales bacterium]